MLLNAEPETLHLKWGPLYSLTTSKQKSEILKMEAHLWGKNAERDIRLSQGVKMSMSLSTLNYSRTDSLRLLRWPSAILHMTMWQGFTSCSLKLPGNYSPASPSELSTEVQCVMTVTKILWVWFGTAKTTNKVSWYCPSVTWNSVLVKKYKN